MSIEEEKKADAEKCLRVAEGAFASGDYVKAERLLKKAERLYPTTLAKQMLKDIQNANASGESSSVGSGDTDRSGYNSESSNTNTSFSGEHHRSEEDKRASQLCLDIANSAISQGNFDKAKNFLLKSIRLYPNDAAKDLLAKLDDLKSNYSSTSYNNSGSYTLGNKDEAEKCIQIAETEFSAGRLAKAERLLKKAERLYATYRSKDLLKQIEVARRNGKKDIDEGETSGERKPRQHPQRNGGQRQSETERPKRLEPTPEQVQAIQRIKQAKDDFEILGVAKGSPIADVRRAFRKLTLILHPDKNKAPGAKEAFMAASEACERLMKKSKQKASQ